MGWFALVTGASSEMLRATFEHKNQKKGFSRTEAASGVSMCTGSPSGLGESVWLCLTCHHCWNPLGYQELGYLGCETWKQCKRVLPLKIK